MYFVATYFNSDNYMNIQPTKKKKIKILTQGEDQSPHNHPGKEQDMCFLEFYWPSVQFHILLSCQHQINKMKNKITFYS